MRLPFLVSVPHAGLRVPPEVEDLCLLTRHQIIKDGDEGAAEVYRIADEVERFVTCDVARAIVDLNRAEDDRRRDGVVKTHTCWDVPVYREPLPEELINRLLEYYHRPYHQALTEHAGSGVIAGIDCHTMAEYGPPEGPDPGAARPFICISNADSTCPSQWLDMLAICLSESFGKPVSLNHPFNGGFIIRQHASELPWIQIELNRTTTMSLRQKRRCLVAALRDFAEMIGPEKEPSWHRGMPGSRRPSLSPTLRGSAQRPADPRASRRPPSS